MIKIWAKVIKEEKIIKDIIYETIENYSRNNFYEHLSEICYKLNISTPVLIKPHFECYENFNNIKFLPRDFVEPFDFDSLVLENALI